MTRLRMVDDQMTSPLTMVVVITLGDLGHTDAGDTACFLTEDSLLSHDGTL